MDDNRKKLLEGIVDTEYQGTATIIREGGTQIVLEKSAAEIVSTVENADPKMFLTFKTFGWVGSTLSTMVLFDWYVRADQILEVQEITDRQWEQYMGDISQRSMQVAQQKAGVVPPRMN